MLATSPLALSISLTAERKKLEYKYNYLPPRFTLCYHFISTTHPWLRHFSYLGWCCHLLFLDTSPGWAHNEVISCQPKRIKEGKENEGKNRRHHKLNFPHSSVPNLLVCLSLCLPVYVHSGLFDYSPCCYISFSPIPHPTERTSAAVVKAEANTRFFILSPIGNSSLNSSGNDWHQQPAAARQPTASTYYTNQTVKPTTTDSGQVERRRGTNKLRPSSSW